MKSLRTASLLVAAALAYTSQPSQAQEQGKTEASEFVTSSKRPL